MTECFFCHAQIELSEARRAEFHDVAVAPLVCRDGKACDARIEAEFKMGVVA